MLGFATINFYQNKSVGQFNPLQAIVCQISQKIGTKTTPPRLDAHMQNEIRNFLGPEAFQDSSWAHWHTLVFDAFGWPFRSAAIFRVCCGQ